jgi:hypothetical protein
LYPYSGHVEWVTEIDVCPVPWVIDKERVDGPIQLQKRSKRTSPYQGEVFIRMAAENDIVLIYFEEKPLVFARIESILPDARPDWYHVKLLLLQVPPQVVTWILRDVYINGEIFTMDGKRMRLERVEAPEAGVDISTKNPVVEKDSKSETKGSVISLKDFKR